MTKREKMIVSAYTGVLMVGFDEFHEWAENYLDVPIWTHELGLREFWDKMKEKSKDEFIEICKADCDE